MSGLIRGWLASWAMGVALGAVFLSVACPASCQETSATVVSDGELRTAVFELPAGTIRVHLTDDMAPGDSVDGAVVTEPKGQTSEQRAQNQDELQGYVVQVAGQDTPVRAGVGHWQLTDALPTVPVVLLRGDGHAAARVSVPCASASSSTPTPGQICCPAAAPAGRPFAVSGITSPTMREVRVAFDGHEAEPLARSPRKVIVRAPSTPGTQVVSVDDRGVKSVGQVRVIAFRLAVLKSLLQRGEKTELTLTMHGLRGLERPLQARVINSASEVVEIRGGNDQVFSVSPHGVSAEGLATRRFTLVGVQPGAFHIRAVLADNRTNRLTRVERDDGKVATHPDVESTPKPAERPEPPKNDDATHVSPRPSPSPSPSTTSRPSDGDGLPPSVPRRPGTGPSPAVEPGTHQKANEVPPIGVRPGEPRVGTSPDLPPGQKPPDEVQVKSCSYTETEYEGHEFSRRKDDVQSGDGAVGAVGAAGAASAVGSPGATPVKRDWTSWVTSKYWMNVNALIYGYRSGTIRMQVYVRAQNTDVVKWTDDDFADITWNGRFIKAVHTPAGTCVSGHGPPTPQKSFNATATAKLSAKSDAQCFGAWVQTNAYNLNGSVDDLLTTTGSFSPKAEGRPPACIFASGNEKSPTSYTAKVSMSGPEFGTTITSGQAGEHDAFRRVYQFSPETEGAIDHSGGLYYRAHVSYSTFVANAYTFSMLESALEQIVLPPVKGKECCPHPLSKIWRKWEEWRGLMQ